MKEGLELLFDIQVVDEYFFAAVASMVDEEGDDRFGDGVVNVFFDHVVVGDD